MLSDRIGAKVRGSQDTPPLSMAEKLLFAFCAAALVFVCLAGYTELDRQGKARTALTQVKAAQLAARAVSAQCYSAGTPFADQSTHDGFAEGIAGQIETLGALPGAVTLLQISEDGYTVEQLLYAEGDMRALYDAETGTVKVGGVDVRDYNLDVLRREVSMVLQKNVLFSGTILDNLRWGDENASEEECIRVAKLACADEFIERFPDKYNTWIEQGGSNVSGGQKQRLTIARALLRKPKVLILDDSTSAVDTATDAKIRKAFREEIPGTTKIIIAQRISSVQDADRILVLDNGQINGLGTHAELLATNAIYQEVYNSQTQGGGDFDKQGGAQ